MVFGALHRQLLVLLLAGGVTAGCSSKDQPAAVDPNLVPTDYRKEIVELMPTLVEDPTNIREAGVTDPFLGPIPGGGTRYMVCVRFNPRNYNKDYVGAIERVGFFYAGKLNQFVKAEAGECRSAAYKPFPELEKICYGKTCS